jgi:adenylosuccinate lyase
VIDRYSSPEMTRIFSDGHRLELWREVELAVIAGYVAERVMGADVLEGLEAVPAPTVARVEHWEAEVRHDVVAFLLAWTDSMPNELSSRVHRGLTSSDVVDTALALQVSEATDVLVTALRRLVSVLRAHALQHRATPRIGRTHGQHATADVWGHRVADFAFAANRAIVRLVASRDEVAVAKLSGTTGTYAQVSPAVEAHAARRLGLRPVECATQVVMRDRLSAWVCALALVAAVCEAVALEVRLGQRTEVGELAEGVYANQVGSSAMPYKANPIMAEQICGLARVVRSYIVPVMDGVPLWSERDLTHSSVDRICVPDAASLTDHIVRRTTTLMEHLVVNSDKMASTLRSAVVASASNGALVALCDAGLGWAEAWNVVRSVSEGGDAVDMPTLLGRLRDALSNDQIFDDVAAQITAGAEGSRVHLDDVFARLEDI